MKNNRTNRDFVKNKIIFFVIIGKFKLFAKYKQFKDKKMGQ